MKSIKTLVEDIQSVLMSHKLSEEAADDFGSRLAGILKERLCEGPPEPSLRMSNFATPDRKLYYTINHPELAEPLSAQAKQKFLYGDIIEAEMLWLIEQSGHTVECKGLEVDYNGIKGHVDAIVDGVVLDIKSASKYAFGKFKNHELEYNDPFGYLDQLSLYVLALQDHPCLKIKGQGGFLAVNKESGEIHLDIYNIKKDYDYEKELLRKAGMLSGDQLPDRCYSSTPFGSSGNKKLPFSCSFCQFKKHCWQSSNNGKGIRSFLYSTGVIELVNVAREPEVEEIT